MTFRATDVWLPRVGAPLGLAVAAVAVSGWAMPPGDPPRGATASITVGATGELGVARAGTVARARDLHTGDGATGRFTVTNQTGGPVAVSLRAALPSRDLDADLHVDAAIGGRTVRHSPLGAARAWSRSVVIGPGERRRAIVRLSVSPNARDYHERRGDVRVELRSEPAR